MQLFPILLIVMVLAADGGVRLVSPTQIENLSNTAVFIMTVLPVLAIVSTVWLVMMASSWKLSRGQASGIAMAELAMRLGRWLLLIHHALALFLLGWLDAIRNSVGDLVLVDELIAISPPLLGMIALWWVHYPIERRIRETLLIRRLDMGKAIYAAPSRMQYVLLQVRSGMLMLLVPLVMILALAEIIQLVAERVAEPSTAAIVSNVGTLIAAACVFIIAPILMRGLLHINPLPAGELRDELMAVCTAHRVRVRELMLWHTNGTMINAAVMGLFGRLRYVLVTDALLDTMTPQQVKAVMAHEVGHVRRHHMPWMVLMFAAALLGAMVLLELPLLALHSLGFTWVELSSGPVVIAMIGVQLVIALLAFGWVSRRLERQADTFAVQHLSMVDRANEDEEDERAMHDRHSITPTAVHAMCSALQTIADLNAVDRRRPSWRHGSIAWRQEYLMSLVGRDGNHLPIDRLVRMLKRTAGAVLLLLALAWLVLMNI